MKNTKKFRVSAVKVHDSLQKIGEPIVNGTMVPLANTYLNKDLSVNFVYYMTCLKGKVKGPYCHTIRNGDLYLLRGSAVVVHREDENAKFKEAIIHAIPGPKRIHLPRGEEYCIIAVGSEDEATFVNICDYAWRPGDKETYVPDFSGYDFSRWIVEEK